LIPGLKIDYPDRFSSVPQGT